MHHEVWPWIAAQLSGTTSRGSGLTALRIFATGLILASALWVAPSFAQEPSVDDVKAAGEQFNLGRTAFKEEDYGVAAEHFERADALAPNAKVLELAIEARKQAGQLDRAAMLVQAAKRTHPSDERFSGYDSLVDKAEKKYARVDVRCSDACSLVIGMRLVHGQPSTEWVLYLEAGAHSVHAGFGGDETVTKEYEAKKGENGVLEFEREEDSVPPGIVASGEPEVASDETGAGAASVFDPFAEEPLDAGAKPKDEPKSAGLAPTWFFIGAGTTAALVGVSTWSALDTVNNPGEDVVRERCRGQGTECPEYQDGVERQGRTNLLWAVTGGAAAVSVVLFVLTDWGGSGESPPGEYSDELVFSPLLSPDGTVGASAVGRF